MLEIKAGSPTAYSRLTSYGTVSSARKPLGKTAPLPILKHFEVLECHPE